MHVEPAKPLDVPEILAMIKELAEFEQLVDECVGTQTDLAESLFGANPVAFALVARGEQGLAGFALYFNSYSTFLCKPGIYLEDLYVRPAYRGQGVGRQLLMALVGLARAAGMGRLEWSVLDWNARAIAFYESLGASPVTGWTRYRLTAEGLAELEGA